MRSYVEQSAVNYRNSNQLLLPYKFIHRYCTWIFRKKSFVCQQRPVKEMKINLLTYHIILFTLVYLTYLYIHGSLHHVGVPPPVFVDEHGNERRYEHASERR